MNSPGRYAIIFGLLLAHVFCGQAAALTVAVFPVEDLSIEINSVSSEMTEFVAGETKKKGLDILPQEKVRDFLATGRIRSIGYLDSSEIMKTRDVLGADLVLLASVCQQDRKAGTLGMTLSVARTSDGMTVWANSRGVSLIDEQRFLGIHSPVVFDDLLPILAEKLFYEWPNDLDLTTKHNKGGEQIAALNKTGSVQVESVLFTPKFVQPGKIVQCTVRFKSNGAAIDQAKFFIKAGNRAYPATSEDGIYYKASWNSSDNTRGKEMQVAYSGNSPSVLKGLLEGGPDDSAYPASLIIEWPSGIREEYYLGSYVVDSSAPEPVLKLHGKIIDGIVSFRKDIPVSVRLKRSEPIDKWEFAVTDSEGNHILSERGGGSLPELFVWEGQNRKNQRVDTGKYSISLKVLDRAGNSSQATEEVFLLGKSLDADVAAEKKGAEITVKISPKDHVPVTSWRMELWSADNDLLTTITGDTLPAEMKLENYADRVDKDEIGCILSVRDLLGSRSKREIYKLFANLDVVEKKEQIITNEDSQTDKWETDF